MDPLSRSSEIHSFSRDFVDAVLKGTAFSRDYALGSNIRQDHHIPTSTAPTSLRGLMEMIHSDIVKDPKPLENTLLTNLEKAFENVAMAHRFLGGSGTVLNATEKESIHNCAAQELPAMRETIDKIRALTQTL